MKETALAEALCLFNRIEDLMRKKGAKGESFSDMVKSFNSVKNDARLQACRDFTKDVGYMFYYDQEDGTYNLKHDYIDDEEEIEQSYRKYFKVDSDEYLDAEEIYEDCKLDIRNYYNSADNALDGFYKNLKFIGHERNQLLHIYGYKIENFRKFKRACKQVIKYLETGKKPLLSKVDLYHSSSDDENTPLSLLIKFTFFTLLIFFGLEHTSICSECDQVEYYMFILSTVLGASLFLFPFLRAMWKVVLFILDNLMLIALGYIFYIFVIKKYIFG